MAFGGEKFDSMAGLPAEKLGEIQARDGYVKHDVEVSEDAAEAETQGKRDSLAEGLEKTGMGELGEKMKGLTPAEFKAIDHALNLVGSAPEQLVFIDSSPEAQTEAWGLIQEVLSAKDDATRNNAARGIDRLIG